MSRRRILQILVSLLKALKVTLLEKLALRGFEKMNRVDSTSTTMKKRGKSVSWQAFFWSMSRWLYKFFVCQNLEIFSNSARLKVPLQIKNLARSPDNFISSNPIKCQENTSLAWDRSYPTIFQNQIKYSKIKDGWEKYTVLKQACSPEYQRAQYAFKNSMIHWSAIHTTYRNSLRSSSLREPRDPLSKVVYNLVVLLWTNKSQRKLKTV